MTTIGDPIDLLRDLNPVPAGTLRELAAERSETLLARLRADEVPPRPLPRSRRLRYAYAAAAVVVVGAAVGAYVLAAPAHSPEPGTSVPSTTTPTSTPPPAGIPVHTAAEADALLSFDVVLPSNATPDYMNVYKWDGRQLLQAYYETRSEGLYSLSEEPADPARRAELETAKHPKVGSAKIVVVDGVHVLVRSVPSAGGDETDAAWIRGDGSTAVITWLTGPWIDGQSFTEEQALAVATDIIGQGG